MTAKRAILPKLVEEDFGYSVRGNGRWGKGIKHDSLVVDEQNDTFFWNSEGIYGGPLEYLTKVRHLPLDTAREFLNLNGGFLPARAVPVEKEQPYDKLVEFLNANGRKERDYWYRRCLVDETIDRFSLGYIDGWYTIPFYNNDSLMNIQCRRDKPSKMIKSWYRGHKPYLFNLDILEFVNTVVITEGPVDAILLGQLGIPAVSHNGGAEYWSNIWMNAFKKQKEVIYIADNDKPGLSAAKKVSKSLGEYKVKIYIFKDKPEKFDTVDFFREGGSLEEFKERIATDSKHLFEGI